MSIPRSKIAERILWWLASGDAPSDAEIYQLALESFLRYGSAMAPEAEAAVDAMAWLSACMTKAGFELPRDLVEELQDLVPRAYPHGRRPVFYTTHPERVSFNMLVGFTIPNQALIRHLAAAPLVEIGAGTGYLSALANQAGGDAIATDRMEPAHQNRRYYFVTGAHFAGQIALRAVEAVKDFPERDVLCSWPDPRSNWLNGALRAMKPGRTLTLLINRGCCGNEALWNVLAAHFDFTRSFDLPEFNGVRNECLIYRKVR